jgi:ABC-type antimicrobial peptide transport system permease subunit
VLGVIGQGAAIAAAGVVAGAGAGYALATLAGSYFQVVRMPGAVPMACSAAVLVAAALCASLVPAVRAARVDVIQALRSE